MMRRCARLGQEHHSQRSVKAATITGVKLCATSSAHSSLRLTDLYQVQYRQLKSDALGVLEPQLLSAVVKEANNPAHVPAGELRKIEEIDPYGQVKTINWIGRDCFVKFMGRPGRHVVKFRDLSFNDYK